MTITNRIKEELFNADISYHYHMDAFKADYPNGVNFCYETVSAKAATAYTRLKSAEEQYNALARLTTPKLERSAMETEIRRLIDLYNVAETEKEMDAAKTAYFSLFTIRA